MELLLLLLGIEVGDDGVLFAEMLLLHAAGDEDHRRRCYDQQQHRCARHFGQAQGGQEAPQGHAADDGGDASGDFAGVEGHEAVVARRVLAEGFFHAAPEEGVHIHLEHIAEL